MTGDTTVTSVLVGRESGCPPTSSPLQRRVVDEEYTGTTATARFARSILQNPYFTPTSLAEYLDVSRPTAYRVIEDLETDGIIEEVTGKEQGKQYKAIDVFEILQ